MPATGELTQRLTFRVESAPTYGTRGELVSAPTDVATVWAAVRPLAGDELTEARSLVMNASHQVTIRYSSDVAGIQPDYWAVWGGKRLDIAGVVNLDQRNEWLILTCAEVIPAAE